MHWTLAVGVALGLTSACLVLNPAFDQPQDTAGATSTSTHETTTHPTSGGASTLGDASTASDTTAATTAASFETGDAASTTTDLSAAMTSTSTTSAGEVSGSTGGGPPPGIYPILPTIAACVLIDNGTGHGPPSVCSANADMQNATAMTGLILVDTEVSSGDGLGRRAESFLRFDIPGEYAGLTVISATLHAQVADGLNAAGKQTGLLYQTSPFDNTSLLTSVPAVVQPLVADQGPVAPNQVVSWPVSTALVQPGQGLHLGLSPVNTFAVIYRGATTPYLELVLQ